MTNNSVYYNTITGSKLDDELTGTALADIIKAGSGADVVEGLDGNDKLYGEAGSDKLYGGNGNDYLNGGSGNDFLFGGSGDDYLVGGEGDDVLEGGEGRDVFAFSVNNYNKSVNFSKQIGQDVIADFKSGEDRIDLSSVFARMADDDVNYFLQSVDDLVKQSVVKIKVGKTYKEYSTETFQGTDEWSNAGKKIDNDVMKVTYDSQHAISSGDLGDQASSFSVNSLSGDTFHFTVGSSQSAGKLQFFIKFMNTSDPTDTGCTITFNDIADIKISDFVMDSRKIAHGTEGDDVMDFSAGIHSKGVTAYGFNGNDIITGTEKSDTLLGYGGNDVLKGGAGDDDLWGHSGNDTLDGGIGRDYLYGGSGSNVMTGGAGPDVFVFGGSLDSKGAFHLEVAETVVTDYKWNTGDKILIANTGNGTGGLRGLSLDPATFDVASHLSRSANGLDLLLKEGNSVYTLQNFFRDNKTITVDDNKDGIKETVRVDMAYLQNHWDHFFFFG